VTTFDLATPPGFDALLADGGLLHVRPAESDDLDDLRTLHAGISDRSMYLRFFSFSRTSAEPYVQRLVRPAGPDHLALTGWIAGRLVGVAAFERVSEHTAEIAMLVADDCHHEGIGTLLLEHLAVAARQFDIQRFDAEVLAENHAALEVLLNLGYRSQVRNDGITERVVLDLSPDARTMQVIDARDLRADEASLRHILEPASIAVIGAGERATAVGHQVLRNILDDGFTGRVYAVNPRHTEVLGVPCVATPELLPEPVDLAVIAVPADQVPAVVVGCGERGVSGLLLMTAGFGETGDAGGRLQHEVVGTARRYGMRLVGPNCLGVVNTDPAIRLNATFADVPGLAGTLGLVSQSGALGAAVLAAAARWGVGVSQFVSVGNKADVSSNDLLLAWEDDPRTRVIALYLESFGNPRKFARIARRVARGKPIIAIKAGRSAAGRLAGLSHTAAAASSDVVVDALFEQAGVLRVDTMEQMLDGARVLCDQPVPRGTRVAVIGNSGGPGILAADAAESSGLRVVQLGPDTERLLRQAVPTAASCRNPVDLGAAVRPEELTAALGVVLAADEVDAVLVVFTDTAVTDAGAVMAQIAASATMTDKPVIATRVGTEPASIPVPGSDRLLPVFTFPEPAAAALALAARYGRIRSAPPAALTRPAGIDKPSAQTIVDRALRDGGQWLDAQDVGRLLTCYGVPMCRQRVADSADNAVLAAAELGYPVAAKVAQAGLHKTDIGGVRLGIATDAELRRAFADLSALTPGAGSILLQPMIPPATEVIIGAVQHDQFGPAVMIGAGGVLANLIADQSFRLAPLRTDDALAMIEELRTARLFDGYRGAPVVSRTALAGLLVRIGALADDFPQVAELDLNPVVCRGRRLVVVDARIRIAPAVLRVDPLLRQLR